MSAINYCHSHGVCHRDIKPENILFSSIEEDSTLKLIDFGLSKVFSAKNHKMSSIVGTTYYMAPEVTKGEYKENCDVWSAGVILYIMLCGRPPFYGNTDEEILKRVVAKNYHFNYPQWNNVSSQAKELIASIFVDAKFRPSSQDVLDHPWVKELAPQSTDEVLNLEWEHITHYSKLNKIQKTVISFASFRLKDEDTRELSEIFNSIDKNSDGVVTIKELKEGLLLLQQNKNIEISDKDYQEIFNEIDLDKNGLINYNEFITATIDYKNRIKKEQIYEAFSNFDSDKSGKLSLKEIADVIKPRGEEDIEYLKTIFKSFDKNNDGEIDWEEFLEGLHLIDQDDESLRR
jgi:calcium-dependent protein kinase